MYQIYITFFFCLFVLVGLEFELRASDLPSRLSTTGLVSHSTRPYGSGYFGDGDLTNYLPRLASNWILLISSSQVARIIGMSHQCLAHY
jgi:hypothetical protein